MCSETTGAAEGFSALNFERSKFPFFVSESWHSWQCRCRNGSIKFAVAAESFSLLRNPQTKAKIASRADVCENTNIGVWRVELSIGSAGSFVRSQCDG